MAIKRKRARLAPLEHGLADVLGAERLARLSEITRLQRRWPEVVGAMLASCTRPVTIESGCLVIAVSHPTIAQQIRFLQQEIREACFRKCSIGGITRLRTRVQPDIAVIRPERRPEPGPVSFASRKRIAADLRGLKHHELRRAIFRARLAQKAFRTSS